MSVCLSVCVGNEYAGLFVCLHVCLYVRLYLYCDSIMECVYESAASFNIMPIPAFFPGP